MGVHLTQWEERIVEVIHYQDSTDKMKLVIMGWKI